MPSRKRNNRKSYVYKNTKSHENNDHNDKKQTLLKIEENVLEAPPKILSLSSDIKPELSLKTSSPSSPSESSPQLSFHHSPQHSLSSTSSLSLTPIQGESMIVDSESSDCGEMKNKTSSSVSSSFNVQEPNEINEIKKYQRIFSTPPAFVSTVPTIADIVNSSTEETFETSQKEKSKLNLDENSIAENKLISTGCSETESYISGLWILLF